MVGVARDLDLAELLDAFTLPADELKQRVFRSSYSNLYRVGLLQLLDVLEFCSSNDVHRPWSRPWS